MAYLERIKESMDKISPKSEKKLWKIDLLHTKLKIVKKIQLPTLKPIRVLHQHLRPKKPQRQCPETLRSKLYLKVHPQQTDRALAGGASCGEQEAIFVRRVLMKHSQNIWQPEAPKPGKQVSACESLMTMQTLLLLVLRLPACKDFSLLLLNCIVIATWTVSSDERISIYYF